MPLHSISFISSKIVLNKLILKQVNTHANGLANGPPRTSYSKSLKVAFPVIDYITGCQST